MQELQASLVQNVQGAETLIQELQTSLVQNVQAANNIDEAANIHSANKVIEYYQKQLMKEVIHFLRRFPIYMIHLVKLNFYQSARLEENQTIFWLVQNL